MRYRIIFSPPICSAHSRHIGRREAFLFAHRETTMGKKAVLFIYHRIDAMQASIVHRMNVLSEPVSPRSDKLIHISVSSATLW
jgi:hypothetical protein